MESHQKRWWIAGGVAVVVLIAVWFLFGGGSPEADLQGMTVEKRLNAIDTLRQKDTPEAARIIQQYTNDNDIKVARHSLYAIARMPKSGSSETIAAAMGSNREEIREAAVAAMEYRGRDRADKPALRDRLARDNSANVRAAAAAALGALRDSDSIPALVAALDDKDEVVQNNAIRSLLDMGGRDHAGAKPGASPQMRAQMIAQLKRDASSFKGVNDHYIEERKVTGR